METTCKETANILALLLRKHGVRHVVCSPGSRNAPVVVAINRISEFATTVVIDERSAGFIALGISSVDAAPVALVCTSGTALLNYMPAIAEARYRKLPLIVISADRPYQWIGQADSQTLPQPDALGEFVKMAVNIYDYDDNQSLWYANRAINDALLSATSRDMGPVHINIQLDKPLGALRNRHDQAPRAVSRHEAVMLSDNVVTEAVDYISKCNRVMVVAGFMTPCKELTRALTRWIDRPGIVVFSEPISNLRLKECVTNIDNTLKAVSGKIEDYRPDLVITIGGSIVSKRLKEFLRGCLTSAHWHVGYEDNLIDCYGILTSEYRCSPAVFFNQITPCRTSGNNSYRDMWIEASRQAISDFPSHPLSHVLASCPHGWNLQLSNGLSVRMAMEMPLGHFKRVDCNRGVSGIDGSTSTALGMSIGDTSTTTLLVTGDMSAAYDIGALAAEGITGRIKIVVVNNQGGGIFRGIESTASLAELKRYFDVNPRLPLKQLAEAYCFNYYCADELDSFITDSSAPAILELITD